MSGWVSAVLGAVAVLLAYPVGRYVIGPLVGWFDKLTRRRLVARLARERPHPRSSADAVSRGLPSDDFRKLCGDGEKVRRDFVRAVEKAKSPSA